MNSHLKLKNKLREFRQKAGLTQTQLAERVGSSKNTISSIETGQFCPTAYLAALLCIALDCKFEEMFYFEEE
jgi:putative transcriptional regulator